VVRPAEQVHEGRPCGPAGHRARRVPRAGHGAAEL